ncbi:hypothetical protein L1887_39958 [Cichorium endivia]|nr:hypothetical protein L1887_39958 [Cichorium endivia]
MSRKRTEDRSPPSPCPAVHRPPPAKRQCTGLPISSTKNEPAHYMLKVESFSILSENPTIKIESDVFEASGYRWRLDLYPNGNEEEEGKNHISLYLILCDTKSLVGGLMVDVKFFVYDHIRENYVTFQDVDGNRARFKEKQIIWGFDKLISLDHFKDNSKGYLFNDAFVFGAEVFVVPEYTLKDRCFSITKPPATTNTYTWTVDNFSAITTNFPDSDVFKCGKVKTLSLFPKGSATGPATSLLRYSNAAGAAGNATGAGTDLSCFLNVHEARLFPDGWRIYAKFELRVKNQNGYDDRVKESDQWFCQSATRCGFECIMPLHELRDKTKGFILNDRLIVEAKILVIGIQKNFVDELLSKGVNVTVFNGQLDLLCATKWTEAWIKKLK